MISCQFKCFMQNIHDFIFSGELKKSLMIFTGYLLTNLITKIMDDKAAKEFINNVFSRIRKSTTIKDLEEIPETLNIYSKDRFNSELYPKIKFEINKEEIQSLVNENILDEEYNFKCDLSSNLTDPLKKLFYAALWKNGDLKKIQHIIKGIVEVEQENTNQENALVFYQFGKHLTKPEGEPIIDQHVIRAFSIYKNSDLVPYADLRNMRTIGKKHKKIINEYKIWLTSDELHSGLKTHAGYKYHIDKIVFAAGKTIKRKK